MKYVALSLIAFFAICSLGSAFAQETEGENEIARNAISVELGGKGILYAVQYERLLTERFGLNVGFSTWAFTMAGLFGGSSSIQLTIIPVYASWYPVGKDHRLYVDAGMDIVRWEPTSYRESFFVSGAIPFVGAGYAYRPHDGGFVFKIGAITFYGGAGTIFPWGNLTLGYAF